MTNLTWVLPTIGGVLLIFGTSLLKRGGWPRRVGDTPHCPKCHYILSDEPERCSECGTPLHPGNIVRGDRHRRPGVAFSGAGLALLGVGLLVTVASGVIKDIDWIRYEPLSWVLNDLGSGNAQTDAKAWGEIQRRIDAKTLLDVNLNAVTEQGLQVQNLTTGTAWNNRAILKFIAARFVDGKLSPGQADRLFAVMLRVRLSARRVVGSHDRVPFNLTGAGRGPDGWWLRVRMLEVQVDDAGIEKLGGGSGGTFTGWSCGSSTSPVPTPGKHHLRVKVELATDVDHGTGVKWEEKARVARRTTGDLSTDFQVVKGSTPITTVTQPTPAVLRRLLTARLTISSGNQAWINMDTPGLPVDAAFDILLRFNGTDHPVGSVSFHKGVNSSYSAGSINLTNDAPATTDVVLRSSESAARDTLDLTQIWKGEIVLRNVPMPKPTTQPATGAR